LTLTNVYVDGFNLYYCALKGTAYKWLDVAALCRHVFPRNTIHRVRYFTAQVSATPTDPDKPTRQQTYLRALGTIPGLTVHLGRFTVHEREMALAHPTPDGPRTALVVRTEEKGSDVNLATYLVRDGFKCEYEAAIVVSNDSDLIEPIRVVRDELRLPVGILNPQMDGHRVAWGLRKVASFYRPLSSSALSASQFSASLQDAVGVIHKPLSW